jgi:hypothetical protein
MPIKTRFRFRLHDRIGDPSAELDQFLSPCFIDNGSFEILADCGDSRALVMGRTGSGKSALLRKLKEDRERVIEIDLHNLALGYIANSTILTFFADLGVNLNQFYKVLWRHVFVVELLKERYHLESEEESVSQPGKSGRMRVSPACSRVREASPDTCPSCTAGAGSPAILAAAWSHCPAR